MLKKIFILLFVFSLFTNNAFSIKKYTWDDLKNIDYKKLSYKKNAPVFIGNYQDYWIDWSPDSSKIIALYINDKNIGIHVLDLSKMIYGLNNQNLFIMFRDFIDKKPMPWKAKIKTEAMKQSSPSWSKYDNIVAYVENTPDYKSSALVIADISKDTYQEINFEQIPVIEEIDFSWNSDLLLVCGSDKVLIFDFIQNKIVKEITVPEKIEQAGWLPDDKNILIMYGKGGYKHDLESGKEEKIIDYASSSQISFIPGTDEYIAAGEGGIYRYNYIKKRKVQLTQGVHYQPQVSHDGRLFSYISETPWGGFVTSTELK